MKLEMDRVQCSATFQWNKVIFVVLTLDPNYSKTFPRPIGKERILERDITRTVHFIASLAQFSVKLVTDK